jgi:putative ABC transport system permease protein
MFKNNFKIALRSLFRQKAYTFINIMGLAVGIASCLLIMLYVQHEFSFDKFFENHDRVYRMVLERKYPNHSTLYTVVPHSFEAVAKRDFAEIEESALVFHAGAAPILYKDGRNEEKRFEDEAIAFVDSSFFKIFSVKFIEGSPARFGSSNEMVVTRDLAKRFFGDQHAMGKILIVNNTEYKITGVCENVPENSHFKFGSLVSHYDPRRNARENFTSFDSYIYFKLRPGADAAALEAKFPKMVDDYASGEIERDLGKSWTDYKKEGNGYRYFLQPLASIHLDPLNLEFQMKPSGNITTIYILIFVAILILVIACINFMNLATARSAERAKEVGVRKVMGSIRKQLITQFLTESFILSAIGVVAGVGIIMLALPYFNSFTQKQLELPFDIISIGGLLLLTVFVGLLAGIYPSFVLSSFNPVVVMKGKFTSSAKGKWIRNGLVVFQFWISIILMIGTLVIGQQMKFMREKSLGFNKEQVLIVERVFNIEGPQAKTFVEELNRLPEVIHAAGSFAMPGQQNDFFGIQFQPEGSSEILTTKSMVVADEFGETLGMELADGRWFSKETNDSLSIMLNETAVKVMGLDDPIGRKLVHMQQRGEENVAITYTITGVVKDFNFVSLRDQVTPLVIQSNEAFGRNVGVGYALVRVKPGQVSSVIKSVEAKWKQLAPAQAFRYSFLDQSLNQLYASEEQMGKLFGVFSGLAIFVACIGLFALSAYITTLRTKEIGVRKVLGASVTGVVVLLSRDISRMVLIAFVLAVPVAWYLMENWWLQNFAYRIQISVWIILVAGSAAFMIAWLTVSYQSVKAATRNPVQSLRYE